MSRLPEDATVAGSARGAKSLITFGVLGGAIGQWVVFLLVMRTGGAALGGQYAALLAATTPIFVITNLGLRDHYITANKRHGFALYVRLRGFGVALAAVAMLGVSALIGVSLQITLLMLLQKMADAFVDILYARLQRSSRDWAFGSLLVLNATLTITLGIVFAVIADSIVWVIAASAIGSVMTLLLALIASIRGVGSEQDGGRHNADLSRRTAGSILASTTPIAGAQALTSLAINLPVMIAGILGSDATAGLFAGLAYMLTAGSVLGGSLNSAVIGAWRNQFAVHGPTELRRRVLLSLRLLAVCGVIGLVAVAAFGPGAFSAIYGLSENYSMIDIVLVASAAILSVLSQVLGAGLLILNEYRYQFFVGCVAVATPILVALIFALTGGDPMLAASMSALFGAAAKFIVGGIRFLRAT